MSENPFCPQCPTETVVDPPIQVIRDHFHPQIVQVIHPIEIINRHHCVPIPQHIYTCTETNETCGISSRNPKGKISKKARTSQARRK